MKKKFKLDDVDVVFDPTPLTNEEKVQISEYIRRDKARRITSKRILKRPKKATAKV